MEEENILIHIGYHKTASTWLQNELFISTNNVFEPISKKTRKVRTLASAFIEDSEGYILSPFDKNTPEIETRINQTKDKKGAIGNKIWVLSNERLSGSPHGGGIDAKIIAERLYSIFPNGKVLIVIREQKSFLLSNYFQYLKAGGLHDISKYLNTEYDNKRPYFSPHHFNYLFLIKEYYRLFGKEKVLVLPYELFKSNPRKFMDELGSFVGKYIGLDSIRFEVQINKRYHYYIRYNFRFLNLFIKKNSLNNYSFLKRRLTRRIAIYFFKILIKFIPSSWNLHTKRNLEQYIVNWEKNRYKKSNKELSQLIGIDLFKYGY